MDRECAESRVEEKVSFIREGSLPKELTDRSYLEVMVVVVERQWMGSSKRMVRYTQRISRSERDGLTPKTPFFLEQRGRLTTSSH